MHILVWGEVREVYPYLNAPCNGYPMSTLLKGAFATNLKAMELATGTCHDLLLGNDHGLDAAKAVVEALLDGVEMQQVEKARLRTV